MYCFKLINEQGNKSQRFLFNQHLTFLSIKQQKYKQEEYVQIPVGKVTDFNQLLETLK